MEGKQESSRKENIIENNMEKAKKFLKDNFKNNTKGVENLYKNIPTPENLLNVDTWQQLLRKKKNTAPGSDNISYEILKDINVECRRLMIVEAKEMWKKGKVKKKNSIRKSK